MKEIIFIAKDSLEGGFEANALGYSIYTQGETTAELKDNILDSVKCHFDVDEQPELIKVNFYREEVIANV